MNASNVIQVQSSPRWLPIIAVLGLLWNIFGIFQFFASFGGSVEGLMQQGMTAEQAELYYGLPVWMTAAFAIGVFGGAIGCVLLLLRKRAATAVFAMSLCAYIVLYAGDIALGVFAAFGPSQVVVLTVVVLIAAILLWVSRHARKQGYSG